jgi:hypothetical protein
MQEGFHQFYGASLTDYSERLKAERVLNGAKSVYRSWRERYDSRTG